MGLAVIKKLKPCSFKYNDKMPDKINFGFIAQDLAELFPMEKYSLVQQDESGNLMVEYYQIIALLTKAIQEQQAQLDELLKERKRTG